MPELCCLDSGRVQRALQCVNLATLNKVTTIAHLRADDVVGIDFGFIGDEWLKRAAPCERLKPEALELL